MRGRTIELTAADGHQLAAYRADPKGVPQGSVVVIQEIFGVNRHIRGVADRFAEAGFSAIAPALFDRVERGVELGYDPEGTARGRSLRGRIDLDTALLDIAAARAATPGLPAAAVGYCWGGLLAWAVATRLDAFAAAVSYYGGGIGALAHEQPLCPTILHFGEKDQNIPLTEVDKVRMAHPGLSIHLYPAGHGFNCEERGSYDRESAELAWQRTMEFLAESLPPSTPVLPTNAR